MRLKILGIMVVVACSYLLPLEASKAAESGAKLQDYKVHAEPLKMAARPMYVAVDKVPVSAEDYVRNEARKYGWADGSEWDALHTLVENESGWHQYSVNTSSGACGLFQALPCSKIGGSLDDITAQAKFGMSYIHDRYGSPSAALNFWVNVAPSQPPYTGHWY